MATMLFPNAPPQADPLIDSARGEGKGHGPEPVPLSFLAERDQPAAIQASTLSLFASIHFCAASSGVMPLSISRATMF
ncbi:unannotated protein [freshwater metagenome]|uniref:Unannotated protein n=1 Tax=freshwater metagenome TaxID=449393 RepID=A0A6J7LKH6_9ZZZZ